VSRLGASFGAVTLVPMTAAIAAPVPAVRPAPLDRLPGTSGDDPFLRLAAGWLVGHPTNTARAYRRDLEGWAAWCARLGVHPLAAERHHVDAWVRHLTTESQPRTGRPASAATVALAPPVVRGLDEYLGDRPSGPLFLASNGRDRYGYKLAYEQLLRLCRAAGFPAGVSPHSRRH
jgi:hypothetical protein